MRRVKNFRIRLFYITILVTLLGGGVALYFPHSVSYTQEQSHDDIRVVPNSLGTNDLIRTLPFVASDVVFNSLDGKLYISSPSNAASIGNTVSRIDPLSGQILNSMFVGSEPNRLALSSDGLTMYVGLDGASAIRKIDVASQTAGIEFALGADSQAGYFASRDILVSPQNSNILAVTRYTSPSNFAPIAIFENGVPLSLTGPAVTYITSGLATTIFGSSEFPGLSTMTVNNSGVTGSTINTPFPLGRIQFVNGRIYTARGQVLDPATGNVLGTFAGTSLSNAFVVDVATGRALYAGFDGRIRAFDLNTFVLLGEVTLTGVNGSPVAMVRYGTNGLALLTTDNRVYLIQTSLLPTPDPLPTPNPTPSITPTPSPAPFQFFFRRVDVLTNDLAFSPNIGKAIVSIPSSVGINGNSIGLIDPNTAQLESTSFVGSEPNQIALSDDGQSMWVGLDGAGSVRKVDILSGTNNVTFSLGLSPSSGPNTAQDIAVVPGSPNSVAVNYLSTSSVGLFDGGVRRGSLINTSGFIDFIAPNELVVGGPTIRRYAITQAGLNQIGSVTGFGFDDYQIVGSRLFLANGRVIDAIEGRMVGRFNFSSQASSVVVDQSSRRVFFLTSLSDGKTQVNAFELDTYRPVGTTVVDVQAPFRTKLFRWGSDGLVWRDSTGRICILRSTLVNPNTVLPTPSPTLTPSPTPIPIPLATFVRTFDVPVGDVAWSQLTNRLYVSVPGVAGSAFGNSISRVEPLTGEISSSAFIGSEPGRLAISDNGEVIYCRLNGAGDAVRRFDTITNTPGLQFNGPGSQTDMVVMPGSPQTLAIASTGTGGGASLWDNGVRRGTPNSGQSPIGTLTFLGPSVIYGYRADSFADLYRFQVSPSGVTALSEGRGWFRSVFGMRLLSSGGLIYASSGQVYDPTRGSLTGTFGEPNTIGAMVVDQAANRVFVHSNGLLTAYDLSTFLRIGSVPVPIVGTATRIVRWGENGLAIRSKDGNFLPNEGNLYVIQSKLVANSAPVPTGIAFNSATFTSSEFVGATAQVSISRTGDLSAPTTVTYETADQTAIAGADYIPSSGSVTFGPGEATKTVTISLINDNVYEPTEVFRVLLSQEGNVNTFVLSPSVASVSINDDENRPGVSSRNRFVGESALQVLVPIQLSLPSYQTVTVNYITSNGTALAGSDYVATSGMVTFAPFETVKSVPVTILSDSVVEGNETFSFALSNAVNANIGTAPSTVTITDSPNFSISGRVLTPGGQGLRNAVVLLVDSNGARRTATTSSFGTYQFEGVLGGQSVTISISSKRYRFTPRVLPLSTDIIALDFIGLE
jgi:hypothetical protein